jgi:hypothetical protein
MAGDPRARFAARSLFTPRFAVPFAVIALVYAVTLSVMPRDGFWIVDEGCRFIQTEGIIRNGYHDLSVPWPGQSLDPDLTFNPLPAPFGFVHDGKILSVFSYPFALVSTFPYRLFGTAGLYLLPLLGGLLTLPAVWLLARRLTTSRLAPPLAMLLVALCTPLWFYSVTFWEHVPALFLTTWAVVLWCRYLERRHLPSLLLSALCCGLSVYLRDELYLFGLVLAAMVLFYDRASSSRHKLLFCLTLVAAMVPLWLFQWRALGNPLGSHLAANTAFYGGLARNPAERWLVFRALLIDSHQSLVLSLLVAAPFLVCWAMYPRVSRRIFRWLVPALGCVGAIAGAIVLVGYRQAASPIWWMYGANALFSASPFLILGFIRTTDEGAGGTGEPEKETEAGARRLGRALWLIVTGVVLLSVLTVPLATSVGVHWGARILLPIYPLLGVLAAGTLARWWRGARPLPVAVRALPALVVVLSLVLQIYALRLLHDRKAFTVRMNEAVLARPERVVVVAEIGVLPELGRCFYDKVLVLLRTNESIAELPALVARAGDTRALFVLTKDPPGPGREGQEVLADRLNFTPVYLRSIEIPGG